MRKALCPRGRRCHRGALVLGLFLAATTLAADQPSRPSTSAEIRDKMARMRADLERKRAANAGAAGAAKRARPAPLPSAGRSRRSLEYHFTSGQSFAYSVEIAEGAEGSAPAVRFRGTPYFTVKAIESEGEAALFVIGKLSCFTRSADASGERAKPARTVWIGSRLLITPSGALHGKDDVNAKVLPSFLELLSLDAKRYLFPELPLSVPGVQKSSGNASLWFSGSPTGLVGIGITETFPGRLTRSTRAELLEPPLVRLTHEVSFQTDPTSKSGGRIDYRSVGRFDRNLGLLRDLDATFRQAQNGLEAMSATVRVRLLQGDALQQAYTQALTDWKDHPAVLEPFEFARVRVDAFLPNHLESTQHARPGMEVLHLRVTTGELHDGDRKYYLAEVLEAHPGTRNAVKIQYKGSNEVLSVPLAEIAYPVSPEHPGRKPGQ